MWGDNVDIFWILPKCDLGLAYKLNHHMVIAPWVKEDESYRITYAQVSGAKMIDNGFHENLSVDLDEYIDLAIMLRANYIICPDVIHFNEGEISALNYFLEKLPGRIQAIFPIHSYAKNLGEYITYCDEYDLIPGLPKRPRHKDGHSIYGRYEVIRKLYGDFPHIHCLGLDLTIELSLLKMIPAYITVDTSLPYKYSKTSFDPHEDYDIAIADKYRKSIEDYLRGCVNEVD